MKGLEETQGNGGKQPLSSLTQGPQRAAFFFKKCFVTYIQLHAQILKAGLKFFVCVCMHVHALGTTRNIFIIPEDALCPSPVHVTHQRLPLFSFPPHTIGLACCWTSYEWNRELFIFLCLASLAQCNI